MHGGYSRYFTPPPFELIATTSINEFIGTTAQAAILEDTAPFGERDNYYDLGGVIWEGGETRLGRTFWTSIDSSVAAGLVAQVLKVAFSRVRPHDSGPCPGDPNLRFKGHGNESFPSGEVTAVSSIVTPFVLKYGRQYPAICGLELLPVYDGIARMKQQAHWQTDVLAGFALGAGCAWLVHRNPNSPFILRIMPHAIYVGIGKEF